MDKRRPRQKAQRTPERNDNQINWLSRFQKTGINLNPAWISRFKRNPLLPLIRSAAPGVLFPLLRDVFHVPPQDDLRRQVEREVYHRAQVLRLNRQTFLIKPSTSEIEADAEESRDAGLQFLKQLEVVNQLQLLGATKFSEETQRQIIRLMQFQNPDGRFPLLYHHHAHTCWILMEMGLEGNRLIDRGLNWLLDRQRDDGGWLHRSQVPRGKSIKTMSSCIWTSAAVLQALSRRRSYAHSTEAQRAGEFLLAHNLKPNSSSFMPTAETWDQLYLGTKGDAMFTGGTLKAAQALVRCGFDHRSGVLEKMINWLLDQQLADGMFPRVAGRMQHPDSNVTFRMIALIQKLT